MIADVAFDAPVAHPFSYRVPDGWALAPGQRVVAPLRGAAPRPRVADPAPILSPAQLDSARWIAGESLSPLGSPCAALLPPLLPDSAATGPGGSSFARYDTRAEPPPGPAHAAPEPRPDQ